MNFIKKNKNNNIGIDISNLSPNFYGGIDTYLNGILLGFSKNFKNYNFQIYLTEDYFKKRKKDLIYKKNFKYIKVVDGIREKILLKFYNRLLPYLFFLNQNLKLVLDFYLKNFIYSKFKKLVEKNSDILISPNVVLKCYNLNIPTILNMHDIQHVHFPYYFSYEERKRRQLQYYNSAYFASKNIASGEFIRKDFINQFPFLKKKISIIHEGIDVKNISKKVKSKKLYNFFKKKKIYKKNFLFLPAQFWEHKNHITVLKGMKILNEYRDINIKLVMCGQKYGNTRYIFEFIKKNNLDNVIYLGVINKLSLRWCLQNSLATICPALYESSSLVNMEAICAKTTVVSSDIPTNLEKRKFFKVNTFKKKSPSSFSKQILKLIRNKNISINQIRFNNKNIKYHDWKNVSRKYLKEAIKILNEKK